MSVVAVTVRYQPQSIQIDEKGTRRYTREWYVQVDSENDDELMVLAASGIPKLWDSWYAASSSDGQAFCRGLSARREDGTRLLWIVTAEYSSEVDPSQGQNPTAQENPLNRPPVIRWGSSRRTEVIVRDREGNAVQNSALDYFQPQPERERSNRVLTVTKNLQTFDDNYFRDFIDSVNSSAFMGAPERCLKCQDITAELAYEDDKDGNRTFFYPVTVTLEYQKQQTDPNDGIVHGGWDYGFVDCGFNKFVGATRERILDEHQNPLVNPVNLDLIGGVLDPGEPGKFVWFRVHDEMDFSGLGII